MAITITSGGAINSGTSTVATLVLGTAQAASIGDTVVVAAVYQGNATVRTCVDSVLNTYTECSTVITFNTTNKLTLWYSKITVAPKTATGTITLTALSFTTDPGTLTVGQAITGAGVTAGTVIASGVVQWNGSVASATVNNSQTVGPITITLASTITLGWTTDVKAGMAAGVITGLDTTSPLDIQGAGDAGTSTTNVAITGTATGTLSQASEIVIGAIGINGNITNYAANSPFTNLTGISGTNMTTVQLDHDIVAATTTVTHAPQWTTSRAYGENVWTFKEASAAAASTHRMTTLGVG